MKSVLGNFSRGIKICGLLLLEALFSADIFENPREHNSEIRWEGKAMFLESAGLVKLQVGGKVYPKWRPTSGVFIAGESNFNDFSPRLTRVQFCPK